MKRWRASVLVPVVAMFGLLVASAAPLAQATVTVTASVNIHTMYLGDTTNTTYAFAVTNNSTAGESIGSVHITYPTSTDWSPQGCGPAPVGWVSSGGTDTCNFNSQAGTADNIAPGATKHFKLVAKTAAGSADVIGNAWTVSVNQADTYSTTGAVSAAPATTGGLTTNIYTWQVTGAVIHHSTSGISFGGPCPAPEPGAQAATTVDVVVCATNHSTTGLTPQGVNSSLAGSLLAKRGAYTSGLIATGAQAVAVATYSGGKVTSTPGSGLTLTAKVGSSAAQTSPRLTITGLLAVAAANWPRFRYDNIHSATNPNEALVGVSDAGTLVQRWSAGAGGGVVSSPAVVNGTLYVGSDDRNLYALNASTGAVKWTATTGNLIESSPTVVNGVVYIGSGDDKLYAYDANGVTNCSGIPKTCAPLWTATTAGQIFSSPTVANGVVYIGSTDGLYAFDAAGVTNCSGSPTTCTPLWTAATGGRIFYSSPAIANGVLYVGAWDDKLYAFSANGTTGCSGAPKTCNPLWTATTGGVINSSPAVANGVVYVGSNDDNLYAYSAAGTTNCSGSPKTCSPLWTGATGGIIDSSPAVANGVVYVGSDDKNLYAFAASGTSGCSGSPTTCSPLWTAAAGGAITSSPAVANGVVYVGAGENVYGWDAAGVVGCSGAPKTCSAVWGSTTSAIVQSAPTVVNGNVYVGDNGATIHAYGLP